MESKDIRRTNLEALIKAHGSIRALADAAKANPAHLSQIRNKVREMGGAFARRLEEELGKPRGWLDMLHDEAPDADDVTVEYLDIGKRRKLDEDTGVITSGLRSFTMSRDWIMNTARATAPNNVRWVVKSTDSMIRSIAPGATVLVDIGVNAVDVPGVYIFARGGTIFTRRAQRLIDGSYMLTADNDHYVAQQLAEKEMRKLEVVGRVLWYWIGYRA